MRHGQLPEDCVQMTGKISPRAFGRRSDANNAPKAAYAGGRGFETGQKTRAILENSRLTAIGHGISIVAVAKRQGSRLLAVLVNHQCHAHNLS